VDKITIVSTGGDGQVGANKLTGDLTKIAAQVPALFEALSGMDMRELMANVKSMRARPNGTSPNGSNGATNGSGTSSTAALFEGSTDEKSN
jgi:flotillin